jgi:tryptophan-rich sensory protein
MWQKIKVYGIGIAIPLAVGGLAAFLTRNAMDDFASLKKPPLSPPGWLFPVVWTVLYILMGIASYLIYNSNSDIKKIPLGIYGIQLFFNFFWSIIFFNLKMYFLAFLWLVVLFLAIWATIYVFGMINKKAAILLVPYLLWVTFAGYLNYAIFLLN